MIKREERIAVCVGKMPVGHRHFTDLRLVNEDGTSSSEELVRIYFDQEVLYDTEFRITIEQIDSEESNIKGEL